MRRTRGEQIVMDILQPLGNEGDDPIKACGIKLRDPVASVGGRELFVYSISLTERISPRQVRLTLGLTFDIEAMFDAQEARDE